MSSFLKKQSENQSGWEFSPCDLCGELEGEDSLALKHQDAPDGTAFIRVCRTCGLKRLWPRPGTNIIHNYYASDYGPYKGRRRSPAKQAIWNLLRDGASGAPGRGRGLRPLRPLFRLLADWIFDINVPLDRERLPRILDVGCGFGDLLLYWQSRGADVLGVDFDERAVEAARKLGIVVLPGALEEQNLMAQSFDVVVFNHSLEHLPSPTLTLQQAFRILRQGGSIHITVPNGASTGLSLEKDKWAAICFPVHFWFFDVITLSQTLKFVGFHNIKMHSRNIWRHRLAALITEPGWQSFSNIWQLLRLSLSRRNNGDLLSVVAIRT